MCNTLHVNQVQHIVCHLVGKDKAGIKLDRVETALTVLSSNVAWNLTQHTLRVHMYPLYTHVFQRGNISDPGHCRFRRTHSVKGLLFCGCSTSQQHAKRKHFWPGTLLVQTHPQCWGLMFYGCLKSQSQAKCISRTDLCSQCICCYSEKEITDQACCQIIIMVINLVYIAQFHASSIFTAVYIVIKYKHITCTYVRTYRNIHIHTHIQVYTYIHMLTHMQTYAYTYLGVDESVF